jgi:uncharacterized protein YeaO (DUF488 family)
MIHGKRLYDRLEPFDGTRLLVERLWLRTRKKATLYLDGWLQEVASSEALRRRSGHGPPDWADLQRHYCGV